MGYLIDTNVLSELRKGERGNANVSAWYAELADDDIFLSVLTIGEIRRGVENIRRRDSRAARALETWLAKLSADHAERVLPISQSVAEEWGRLNVPDPLPVVDGLLAATAKIHSLTLVTRNVADIESTKVPCVNPFESPV